MDTRTYSNRRKWIRWYSDQKGCQNHTNTYERNILPFYQTTLKTRVPKCVHTRIRDKAISKTMNAKLAKIPDCPRRTAVAELRLCVGHDCLRTHLHRTGIHPVPYCMLCSLHETMDRNHLGRYTALSRGTECERYWKAGTKMMENWLLTFYFCD